MVGFLLPCVPFWHSTLSLRIENPYTQWVWIANQTNGTAWSIRWIGMGHTWNIRWVGWSGG